MILENYSYVLLNKAKSLQESTTSVASVCNQDQQYCEYSSFSFLLKSLKNLNHSFNINANIMNQY
jgi:hypothetical protein